MNADIKERQDINTDIKERQDLNPDVKETQDLNADFKERQDLNTDIKARQDLNADIKERHKTYTLTLMRDTRPSISMSVLLKAEGLQLVPDSVAALQRLGVAARGAIPPGPGGRAPQRLPHVLGPHLLEQFSTFMSLLGAN